MQQCPKCQSSSIHRSHTRNLMESWRKAFTTKRPHRCQRCGWRGWGEETTPKFDPDRIRRSEEAVVPEPADVDLNKL
jgi:predicted RNA-binding Zn-ribbon protein involved in translation (DUF1610 family)